MSKFHYDNSDAQQAQRAADSKRAARRKGWKIGGRAVMGAIVLIVLLGAWQLASR